FDAAPRAGEHVPEARVAADEVLDRALLLDPSEVREAEVERGAELAQRRLGVALPRADRRHLEARELLVRLDPLAPAREEEPAVPERAVEPPPLEPRERARGEGDRRLGIVAQGPRELALAAVAQLVPAAARLLEDDVHDPAGESADRVRLLGLEP